MSTTESKPQDAATAAVQSSLQEDQRGGQTTNSAQLISEETKDPYGMVTNLPT